MYVYSLLHRSYTAFRGALAIVSDYQYCSMLPITWYAARALRTARRNVLPHQLTIHMWLRGDGTTNSEDYKWVAKHVIADVRNWHGLSKAEGPTIQGPRMDMLGRSNHATRDRLWCA